jgi:MbtH protein
LPEHTQRSAGAAHSAPAGAGTAPAQTLSHGTLMSDDREDTTIYEVVNNDEEQYSIWPADRELPLGWHKSGKQGLKAECLAYIEEVWTDMRPKSLREQMQAQGLG